MKVLRGNLTVKEVVQLWASNNVASGSKTKAGITRFRGSVSALGSKTKRTKMTNKKKKGY
jgi:hypothetical protein